MRIFRNPLRSFFKKKVVGIDIGTSSVKVVEISLLGNQKKLENYGEIKSDSFYKGSLSKTTKGSYLFTNGSISKIVRAILDESHIKTKSVVFSIPDFSTFCTSFDIPPMTEKEIPDAIRYNASQYITLPISEVTLDWRTQPNTSGDKNASLKVFLVAVPNQVVQEYQAMAKMVGLELHALEAEAMGVTRALVKDNKKTVCLVDIGVQSSTINVIDRGFLKKSYSFSFNSSQLSHVVSSVLGVDLDLAEDIKNKEGLMHTSETMVKNLYLLIDPLLIEIKSVSAEFFQSDKKQIEGVYLTGGTANLPGLREYFAESLKKEVYIPNCFSGFSYPPILEETLKKMGPSFSAAVGVALGDLET